MMFEQSPTGGFRESILKEVFSRIGFKDAVGLVGILYERRIVFSKHLRTLVQNSGINIDLEPLEPQAAAILVGQLFGHDCDQLFLAFANDWATLKGSPRIKGLIAEIQSHQYVEHLEPWPAP